MLTPVAFIFLFGATIFYASLTVIWKKVGSGVPPFLLIGISMAVLCITSLGISFLIEKDSFNTLRQNRSLLLLVVFGGLVNLVAFWFYLKSLDYVSVWQYQLFATVTPIFGAVFAYFFLGEPVSAKLFLGLAFVAVGLGIALQ